MAKKKAIDWVEVGRLHARAEWEKQVGKAVADGVAPLERTRIDPCPIALAAVYGPVMADEFGAYSDAYRSELHLKGLRFHEAMRRARKQLERRQLELLVDGGAA